MIRVHPVISDLLHRGDVHGVRAALQSAIELEHSVIPPYLYALYSLVPGRNDTVAGILRSVVMEEMLHLALAANLLNAVGGRPVLDSPRLLSRYPGPLPGTVDDGLTVGLLPFSVPLVRDTFMVIEQPEHALGFGAGTADSTGGPEPELAGTAVAGPGLAGSAAEPLTIGQFYRRIRTTLVSLGDRAYTGRRHHQVGTGDFTGAFPVTGVMSASRAIDTIIDQGEGTLASPLESAEADVAHYYRFAEVVHGRRLARNPAAGPDTPADQRYLYTGDPLPFDESAVFGLPPNPTLAGLPADGAAYRACAAFNYTYTRLLKSLHAAFNGTPGELAPAIALMASLRQQAVAMASGAGTGGKPAGPSFEWHPTAVEVPA